MGGTSSTARSLKLEGAFAGEFLAYLDRLLSTTSFASSRRRCQLLRYLAERTIAGEADHVSEYAIGLDVFQKPASFDPRAEATVRVEISRLRRALSDHYAASGKDDPWLIQLPSRGYALTISPNPNSPAELSQRSEVAPPAAAIPKFRFGRWVWILGLLAIAAILTAVLLWRTAKPQPIHSVVVLPFANLTGEAKNDYLADGVTEQLTDSLAHMPDIRVVARTSAFQFKGKALDIRQIGRQVNADAVVEGSLRTINGKLRLTVQLNRSSDGFHVISQTIDGSMQELARLENEMTAPVVAALRPGSSAPKRRMPNPEAYDYYLKAEAQRANSGTKGAFEQGIGYLNQAIAHDPGFADAYAALAGVYGSAAVNFASEPLEYARKSKAAASRALELDPLCARAYAAEGLMDALVFLEWRRGEDELRNAMRLAPSAVVTHNWLGLVLLAQGQFPEALKELRAAGDLDPLIPNIALGVGYIVARRYDDALRHLTEIRDLHPDNAGVHMFIGGAWECKERFDKAREEYESGLSKLPYYAKPRLAHLLALSGQKNEARTILAELEHPAGGESPNAYDLAFIYGALGERNKAFLWLDRAYEQRNVSLLKVDPLFDTLRSDPRFKQLLGKAGFLP